MNNKPRTPITFLIIGPFCLLSACGPQCNQEMVVNGQGEIILFGDPLLNDLAEELFISIAKVECGI